MSCRAAQRRRIQKAESALAECNDVLDVTVITADEEVLEKPTLDVVLRPTAGGVSPTVASVGGEFSLTVRGVQRQGMHWQALFVA